MPRKKKEQKEEQDEGMSLAEAREAAAEQSMVEEPPKVEAPSKVQLNLEGTIAASPVETKTDMVEYRTITCGAFMLRMSKTGMDKMMERKKGENDTAKNDRIMAAIQNRVKHRGDKPATPFEWGQAVTTIFGKVMGK